MMVLFLAFYYVKVQAKAKETFDSTKDIVIVVARYNENLEWLKEEPFNKYNVIVYNSGDDENFYRPENMKVVKLDNIGKEAYTYLYHICKNYDNLDDFTIFLPGSSTSDHKYKAAVKIVQETEKHRNTVFISTIKCNDVRDDWYNFYLDEWCSTSKENSKKNSNCKLTLSSVRPFGAWYDKFFKDIKTKNINYCGILSFKKEHILQRPLDSYETLLAEFKEPNDEVAHYFERAWEAIFYPLDDAVFIDQP